MDVVLIHGAYHGAWCWNLVTPELEALGHHVLAVDMPIDDPSAGAAAYAEAVVRADARTGPRVVVAHSMGGLVAPLVAERRPVARMVFLAAFLPKPGVSANEQRAAEPLDPPTPPSSAEWTDLGNDVWRVGPTTASEMFFGDVPDDVRAWALARLRPQCYRIFSEPTPLLGWPDVPSDYIVCRHDRAINPAWGRQAAVQRLGVEPVEIDGGHSPMLTRPAELARLLNQLIAGETVRG